MFQRKSVAQKLRGRVKRHTEQMAYGLFKIILLHSLQNFSD